MVDVSQLRFYFLTQEINNVRKNNTYKKVSVFCKECDGIFLKSFLVICSFGDWDVTFELFQALRPLLRQGLHPGGKVGLMLDLTNGIVPRQL